MGGVLSVFIPRIQNQHEDHYILDQHNDQFTPNNNENMQLFVKTVTKIVSLEVQRLNTIMEIKQKICDIEKIPVQQQKLIYCNYIILKDNFTLCDYDFRNDTMLHLISDRNNPDDFHHNNQDDIHDETPDGTQLTLFIRCTGHCITIKIDSSCLVFELLNKLSIFRLNGRECNPIHNDMEYIERTRPHLLYGSKELNYFCKLSDYHIKDEDTISLVVGYPGGGSIDDCISHCSKCDGSPCNVVKNCFHRKFVYVNNAKEYPWLAVCKVFNIDSNVRQKIIDNSEDITIRCVDVLHHIFHADQSNTWSTIKLKLRPQYPELAREI